MPSHKSRSLKKSSLASKVKKVGSPKLISVKKSPLKDKKLRATFSDGTHTDFGYAGMSDYTKHKDKARRARYIARHKARENWGNYKSRGALSRYILWGDSTSLRENVARYKRKFGI